MQKFQIGRHDVTISRTDSRWLVAIDGAPQSLWFLTEAEAWAKGVREAQRLDQEAAALPAQ